MNNPVKYFLLGTVFWIVVDFTTTTAIKNPGKYYSMYMPALLLFYVGFPLLFSLLIYKYKLSNTTLFISTLIAVFATEIIFTHNPLLYTMPFMLFAIPVAVSLYSFITFVPKWIVDQTIWDKKWKMLVMTTIWILVLLATFLGRDNIALL